MGNYKIQPQLRTAALDVVLSKHLLCLKDGPYPFPPSVAVTLKAKSLALILIVVFLIVRLHGHQSHNMPCTDLFIFLTHSSSFRLGKCVH